MTDRSGQCVKGKNATVELCTASNRMRLQRIVRFAHYQLKSNVTKRPERRSRPYDD